MRITPTRWSAPLRFPIVVLVFTMGLAFLPGLTPSTVANGAGDPMPDRVASLDPERPWPVFVAAELAISPTGEVAGDLFHPAVEGILGNMLREPRVDGCIQVTESYDQGTNTPRFDSTGALVANAERVVRGRVTGARAGFVHGVPGQLLRIEPIRWFKGEDPADQLFVFFPVVRIEIGEIAICKTDVRYGRVPEPGDEVLVAARNLRDEAEELFFRLPENGTGVIVLDSDGAPEDYPRALRAELGGKSGALVLDRVESFATHVSSKPNGEGS